MNLKASMAAVLLAGVPASARQEMPAPDLTRAFDRGVVSLCDLSPQAERIVRAMFRARRGPSPVTLTDGLRATIERRRRRVGVGSTEHFARATFVGRVMWRGLLVRSIEERSFDNVESESPVSRRLVLAAPPRPVRRALSRLSQDVPVAPDRRVDDHVGLNGASLWIEPSGAGAALVCETND